jgi:glycine/D-amino acid oxidase-like deaminating enzyme
VNVTRSADFIVVGGGAIGAATLFELARRGARALLLERKGIASESTGKSAAIIRMHYSNPPVVRMALRSRHLFQHFRDLTGAEQVYFETGWTFLVPADAIETARGTAEMTRAEGVEVVEIDFDRASELYPGLVEEGIGAIFLEPNSGFANPHKTSVGYIQAAKELGAEAREGVTVERLVAGTGGIVGVQTSEGILEADTVVLAAGPWSAILAATVGIDLPYQITREEEIYVRAQRDNHPRAAMSNLVEQIYMRPLVELDGIHPGATLIGRGFPKDYELVDPDDYDEELSAEFEEDVRARLAHRLPGLACSPKLGGVVGLYAVTPDWHPYLGTVDGVDGLALATGGSGHCFKLAPAIGEMVAGHVVGEQTSYADIDLFNLRRVEAGALFGAAIGGNRA